MNAIRSASVPQRHRRPLKLLMLLAPLWLAGNAFAGELRVRAPVIDVEPITGPASEVQRCDGKPAASASLADLIAWDLGLSCRTEHVESATVTGYRVFYRWDDRVYSQVMSSPPGPTISLRVRLD